MSRKRSATGDALTGGTNDVNGQYISGAVTVGTGGAAVELTLGTPIVRVGQSNPNHAIIMEILKLYVDIPDTDNENATADTFLGAFSMSTATSGGTAAILPLSAPRCLASMSLSQTMAFTAAGTGLLHYAENPKVWDFTDGAGHGILVATDNLFLQAQAGTRAAGFDFNFKILYRFKKVSLVEYIGIVQSQQ